MAVIAVTATDQLAAALPHIVLPAVGPGTSGLRTRCRRFGPGLGYPVRGGGAHVAGPAPGLGSGRPQHAVRPHTSGPLDRPQLLRPAPPHRMGVTGFPDQGVPGLVGVTGWIGNHQIWGIREVPSRVIIATSSWPLGQGGVSSMSRRGKKSPAEDLMEIVAMLPWWAGVALALLSYILMHRIANQGVGRHSATGGGGDDCHTGVLENPGIDRSVHPTLHLPRRRGDVGMAAMVKAVPHDPGIEGRGCRSAQWHELARVRDARGRGVPIAGLPSCRNWWWRGRWRH